MGRAVVGATLVAIGTERLVAMGTEEFAAGRVALVGSPPAGKPSSMSNDCNLDKLLR